MQIVSLSDIMSGLPCFRAAERELRKTGAGYHSTLSSVDDERLLERAPREFTQLRMKFYEYDIALQSAPALFI